jgi:hypothetical protein
MPYLNTRLRPSRSSNGSPQSLEACIVLIGNENAFCFRQSSAFKTSAFDERQIANALIDNDTTSYFLRVRRIALVDVAVNPSSPGRKAGRGNESVESMESHEAGFPPFPHSLEIPSGFPHSHGLDDWIYIFRTHSARSVGTAARGL